MTSPDLCWHLIHAEVAGTGATPILLKKFAAKFLQNLTNKVSRSLCENWDCSKDCDELFLVIEVTYGRRLLTTLLLNVTMHVSNKFPNAKCISLLPFYIFIVRYCSYLWSIASDTWHIIASDTWHTIASDTLHIIWTHDDKTQFRYSGFLKLTVQRKKICPRSIIFR